MNKRLQDLLVQIENDNVRELEEQSIYHRFGWSFDRRAQAACRGGNERVGGPFRRPIPIWAAVLIILLLLSLLAGCAVAIHKYLTRYIPYYGIVELDSNVKLYSSAESIKIGSAEIETLLYVDDGESGRLMMWASGAITLPFDLRESSEKTVASVSIDGERYALTLSAASSDGKGHYSLLSAEATAPSRLEVKEVKLEFGGQNCDIKLKDISRNGYSVSNWVEVNGITVKILPLYTNDRIMITSTSGIEGATISATYTVYDRQGNTARANGGYPSDDGITFLNIVDEQLKGDVVKIEIDSLRVRVNESLSAAMPIIPIPASGKKVETDIPAFSTELFDERIISVENKDGVIYMTSELEVKTDIGDISTMYNIPGSVDMELSTAGYSGNKIISVTKFRLKEDVPAVTAESVYYSYTIYGDPLGAINYKKEK